MAQPGQVCTSGPINYDQKGSSPKTCPLVLRLVIVFQERFHSVFFYEFITSTLLFGFNQVFCYLMFKLVKI